MHMCMCISNADASVFRHRAMSMGCGCMDACMGACMKACMEACIHACVHACIHADFDLCRNEMRKLRFGRQWVSKCAHAKFNMLKFMTSLKFFLKSAQNEIGLFANMKSPRKRFFDNKFLFVPQPQTPKAGPK